MSAASPAGRDQWDWGALGAVALHEARRLLDSPHDAEDAAQEAMIRAYKARSRCETPDAPQAWIRAIARREAFRLYRRLPRGAGGAAPALHGVGEDGTEAVLDRLLARSALRQVSPAERLLLVRRYVLDQTSTRIAEDLALPAATVRVQLHRAIKRVQTQSRLRAPP
jgi:RNA polymerase sigma factor (sigma-70 family)